MDMSLGPSLPATEAIVTMEPLSALDHVARDQARAGVDGAHVEVEHAVDVLVRGLEQRPQGPSMPALFTRQSTWPKRSMAALEHASKCGFIQTSISTASAVPPDASMVLLHALRTGHVAVGDHDVGAAAGKPLADGLAEAGCAASDDGDASG